MERLFKFHVKTGQRRVQTHAQSFRTHHVLDNPGNVRWKVRPLRNEGHRIKNCRLGDLYPREFAPPLKDGRDNGYSILFKVI